jgi:glutamate synthase (NADPH/NADH) large chain
VAEEEEAMEALEPMGNGLESHGLVDLMHDMSCNDERRLRALIERHVRYTDSAVGKRILADWRSYLPKFVKVMPVDYRDALERMKLMQQGRDQRAAAGAKGGY